MNGFKLIAGNANSELAAEVSKELSVKLVDAEIKKFEDGEAWIEVNESVRGETVFVIQPTCKPVNDNLMELLVLIDALKRSSAEKIIAVIPYYGYARQDQKSAPRQPISAKLVAKLLESAGVDRVVSIDLHAGQIQGFFEKPFDNLSVFPLVAEHFKKNFKEKPENVVVVSADVGGAKRAQKLSNRLGTHIAVVSKYRQKANESRVTHVVGDVQDKLCVLYDDMIDTGGSLANAAVALKENGAKKIIAYCTHPLLSGDAVKKIEDSPIEKLVVTNTIPLAQKSKKIEVVSIAPLLAEAIKRLHENKSLSELFK